MNLGGKKNPEMPIDKLTSCHLTKAFFKTQNVSKIAS